MTNVKEFQCLNCAGERSFGHMKRIKSHTPSWLRQRRDSDDGLTSTKRSKANEGPTIFALWASRAHDRKRVQWKSAQRRCKHCALAVVRRNQNFSPHRRPLPGGAWRPKFNQLETVTTFTYMQTQFGEDRCTQFRVIVVTDPFTHKHTYIQDRLQYTAPQLASAQCN